MESSSGLRLLQMVSEPDTGQYVNEEAKPRKEVDTRQCASKDAGPRRRVDWGGPTLIGEGNEFQRGC